MLCFSAYGPLGNSTAAIAGYRREIALASSRGLDGFAVEYLGRDEYYAPSADGMFKACAAYNEGLSPGGKPFRLFLIINFCCGLTLVDAAALYMQYHNHPCAQTMQGRPVFSSWSAIDWSNGARNETARWTDGFYAPIAAAGQPRPFFFPFIYAFDGANYEETATLAEQRQTLSDFSRILDGLWYWGCAPKAPEVVSSSQATVQACREAGKLSAVPVSAPYSPHIGDRHTPGNNRYTQSNGAKGLIETWEGHIRTQPDMVIFTTWNDLGEHHYVGPYNITLWGRDTVTGWDGGRGPNKYPHNGSVLPKPFVVVCVSACCLLPASRWPLLSLLPASACLPACLDTCILLSAHWITPTLTNNPAISPIEFYNFIIKNDCVAPFSVPLFLYHCSPARKLFRFRQR